MGSGESLNRALIVLRSLMDLITGILENSQMAYKLLPYNRFCGMIQ